MTQQPIVWPDRDQHPSVRVNDPDTCQEPSEFRMSKGRLAALAGHVQRRRRVQGQPRDDPALARSRLRGGVVTRGERYSIYLLAAFLGAGFGWFITQVIGL